MQEQIGTKLPAVDVFGGILAIVAAVFLGAAVLGAAAGFAVWTFCLVTGVQVR